MRTLEVTLTVKADGTAIVAAPPDVAPGPHRAVLVIEEKPISPNGLSNELSLADFPVHDLGSWPIGLSLRREDMYDEWGR